MKENKTAPTECERIDKLADALSAVIGVLQACLPVSSKVQHEVCKTLINAQWAAKEAKFNDKKEPQWEAKVLTNESVFTDSAVLERFEQHMLGKTPPKPGLYFVLLRGHPYNDINNSTRLYQHGFVPNIILQINETNSTGE